MNSKMMITANLSQRLSMNQQLRQAIALLQYNTIELRQLVQQQLDSNPLLELEETEQASETTEVLRNEEEDDLSPYSYSTRREKPNSESYEYVIENYSKSKSLKEHLLEQTLLCQFNPTEQLISETIIDLIDDNGFITLSREELYETIIDQHQTTDDQILAVLNKIQTFDPSGVAAFNIRDCLQNQINNYELKNSVWELALNIIQEISQDFSITRIKKIMKEAKESNNEYSQAIDLIKKLNFYPGSQYLVEKELHFEPELYVKKIGNQWRVFLNDGLSTNIKINKQYQELIKQDKRGLAYQSLKQELEEAKWLINGLKKRNETLLNVANYIVDTQKDFLDYGLANLKPLNIIDAAMALNVHESTVSRVTNGKYIATPQGVFELKYFFPSHVATESGENRSDLAVKSLIRELIGQETPSNVYSDSDIVSILKEKGINIARRTVSKYRESMNILSSYQRQMQHNSTADERDAELELA